MNSDARLSRHPFATREKSSLDKRVAEKVRWRIFFLDFLFAVLSSSILVFAAHVTELHTRTTLKCTEISTNFCLSNVVFAARAQVADQSSSEQTNANEPHKATLMTLRSYYPASSFLVFSLLLPPKLLLASFGRCNKWGFESSRSRACVHLCAPPSGSWPSGSAL